MGEIVFCVGETDGANLGYASPFKMVAVYNQIKYICQRMQLKIAYILIRVIALMNIKVNSDTFCLQMKY